MAKKEEAQFKWLRDNSDILTESERDVLRRYNTELLLAEYKLHKLYELVRKRLDREDRWYDSNRNSRIRTEKRNLPKDGH